MNDFKNALIQDKEALKLDPANPTYQRDLTKVKAKIAKDGTLADTKTAKG